MTDRKPRQRKTPRERAEEALQRAERELATAKQRYSVAAKAADALELHIAPLQARRDHLAQDPALSDPIPESDTPLPVTTDEGTTTDA